jgi:hypothetical protein
MENKMVFGEDLWDFIKLFSGQVAGRNLSGIFVTEEPMELEESKSSTQFFPATDEQEMEYIF